MWFRNLHLYRLHDAAQADAAALEAALAKHAARPLDGQDPRRLGWTQPAGRAGAALLAPGGRLVAILPSSAQGSFHLPGLACRWDGPHHNQFAGASVSVSLLIADKEDAT